MKRWLSILTIAMLLLSWCGCTQKQEEFIDPINFYFLQNQPDDHILHGNADSVITPVKVEGNKIRRAPALVLEAYFATQSTEVCHSPFPENTKLVSWEANGHTLIITLSDEVALLTGIDLSLACASLTITCMELWNYNAVQIRADTMLLDGKTSITMNAADLLLVDDTLELPKSID